MVIPDLAMVGTEDSRRLMNELERHLSERGG
jgi:hypothetical protein